MRLKRTSYSWVCEPKPSHSVGVLVHTQTPYRKAVLGEGTGDRPADTARGARDDDRLAVEADVHPQASSSKAVSLRPQMTAVETTAAAIR